MIKIIPLILILTSCASVQPLSSQASKVQVIAQDSAIINKCTNIKPISTIQSHILPADKVYSIGVSDLLEQAASVNADSISITNTEHDPGIKNTIRIQATAMKCY